MAEVKAKKIRRKKPQIGGKYGFLTVLYKIGVRKDRVNKNHYYRCLCECGSVLSVRSDHLILRKSPSCGCQRNKSRALPGSLAAFNHLYGSYSNHSRYRGRSFVLSKEEFRELTLLPCFYCGAAPKQEHWPSKHAKTSYIYNGIDRVDNALGYTSDNVVPCCRTCNTAKNKFTQNAFLAWIRQILKHHSDYREDK